MTRSEAADRLESERDDFLMMMRRCPLEIECGPPNTPSYWRAVIDSREEFDLLLAQLRATSVSPEEAVNGSLVI